HVTSLDGYHEGPGQPFDWPVVDAEFDQFAQSIWVMWPPALAKSGNIRAVTRSAETPTLAGHNPHDRSAKPANSGIERLRQLPQFCRSSAWSGALDCANLMLLRLNSVRLKKDRVSLDDSRAGRGWLLVVLCRFSAILSGSQVGGGWRCCPIC